MTAGFPLAVIFGCSGPVLGDDERRFFGESDPLGFILFARNCENPGQVRRLVEDLRACVGRADAPILVDQEGGRVVRLKPPHWRAPPAPARFAKLARRDPRRAVGAARLNARLIAAELFDLGITVNCAPVLDLPRAGADPIIGDRAAGDTPDVAALLGRAACEGFLAGGVAPVIKHIPGHGRATSDSHKELPLVEASWKELERFDFAPFRALKEMPWAMTAHVAYQAVDGQAPATTSAKVIEEVIRGAIGFQGLLVSDDLEMRALQGGLDERARAALAAGCDLLLHCNGSIAEMSSVAGASTPLSRAAAGRLARAGGQASMPQAFDTKAAAAELDDLLVAAS